MSVFHSSVVVVLTIVACVSGAPTFRNIPNPFGNIDSSKLMEPLVGPIKTLIGEAMKNGPKNLDQIGGGQFIRNLDHIGGGNLLRNVKIFGKPETKTRRDLVDPRDVSPWYDTDAGGNFVQQSQFNKNQKNRWSRSLTSDDDQSSYDRRAFDSYSGFVGRRNNERYVVDSLGGGNLVQRRMFAQTDLMPNDDYVPYTDNVDQGNKVHRLGDAQENQNFYQSGDRLDEQRRNLDHIGGGNLLRDLHSNQ